MSTVAFWSLATSPGHVGIQHGKLMWHKIQPSPIRCFTWAEPNNSAHLVYLFLLIFVSYMGQALLFSTSTSMHVWPFKNIGTILCNPFSCLHSAFLYSQIIIQSWSWSSIFFSPFTYMRPIFIQMILLFNKFCK